MTTNFAKECHCWFFTIICLVFMISFTCFLFSIRYFLLYNPCVLELCLGAFNDISITSKKKNCALSESDVVNLKNADCEAENISNFIFSYVVSIPNLAVRNFL